MSVAKRSTQTLFFSLLSTFVGIVTGIIVARVLGPAGKGQAAVAVAAPALLSFLGNLGIPSAIVYYIGQKEAKPNTFFATVTAVSLLISSVVIVVVWLLREPVLATILRGLDLRTLRLSLIGVPLAFLSVAYGALLLGKSHVRDYNMTQLTNTVSSLILTILFVVVLHWGVFGAVLATLLATTLRVLESARYILCRLGISLSLRRDLAAKLVKYGWQVHLGNAISILNNRIDLFVLNALAGNAAVGVFSLAVNFAELLNQVPEAMRMVIHPKLVADRDYADRTTPRACRQMIIIGFSLSLVALALAKPLILVMYGREFLPAASPFAVLLPGVVALGVTKLLFADVQARGKPIQTAYAMAIGLVPHIGLDFLLIPVLGSVGAAIAASVSYTVTTVFCTLVFSRLSGVSGVQVVAIRAADFDVYRDVFAKLRAMISRK